MNWNAWSLIALAAILPWNGIAEPQSIVDRNKVEQGLVICNEYSYVAVMNPSRNDGKFGARDFRIMPLTRSDQSRTLDENEAMFRFLLRADCQVFGMVGKNRRTLAGNGEWSLKPAGDSGVAMARTFGPENQGVAVTVDMVLDRRRSTLDWVVKFVNRGEKEYIVDFLPTAYTLIQELRPLRLVLPRMVVRYQIGGKVEFWRNELTVLDNDYEKYWWRKAAEDVKPNYIQNLYLEKIEFNHPRILPPQSFGLVELRGNAALIFEFPEDVKMGTLELRWQKDIAQMTPMIETVLKPGENREIKFRTIMVRGLERYDNIEDGWVFAYLPIGDTLRMVSAPLAPTDRISVNLNLNDQRGTSLINQRSEMAAMNPFRPGVLAYRTTVPFVAGERYPVKMVLNLVKDNSRLLEVAGEVAP